MKKTAVYFCLIFLLFSGESFSQTIFWTENFNNGCSSDCIVNTYNGPNGFWTVTSTGTNQNFANEWYVSCAENGENVGQCGAPCGNNATLHVGSTILGDIGAAYYSGFGSTTNKRAESPTIDCSGKSNITVDFKFIQAGQANVDVTTFYYFDGNIWTNILQIPQSNNSGCGGQGFWTQISSINLPASADNNPNVKIGFNWTNNNNVATDPSFAVDDVTLSSSSVSSNTINTGSINGSPFCAGDNITIPFNSTGTFSAGNIYTAQLSNSSGSFAAPVSLGTLNSTANSGNINGVIPPGTPTGAGYLIRVVSSNPSITGTTVGPITINQQVSASVSISSVPSGSICAGDNVVFTANITNGGAAPQFQWQVNGVNVPGATLATFSTTTLANNDLVTVVLTSNAPCVNNSPVISSAYTALVNPILPVSVSITSNPNSPICPGDNVNFTANPVNGGTIPGYQWTLNGVNIPGANGSTFSTNTLSNSDHVAVILTSSEPCASGNPATSNQIIQTVNPSAPVSVVVSVSPSGPVCAGTNLTFTASPVNGGSAPTYVWTVNGVVQSGVTGNTFSSSFLNDGDIVMAELNSNEPCATGNPANSNSIAVQVQSNIVASVTISADANPVCAGATVNFSASLVGAGSNPVFQWSINGLAVSGANDSIFSSSALNDGDIVVLNMISSSGCVTNPNVNSQNLVISVINTVNTGILISVSQDTLCSGVAPLFSSTLTGGGSNPLVDWFVDGVLITSNQGSSFNPGLLTNGQFVFAQMQSSLLCASPQPAVSDTITMVILPDVAPEVLLTVDFDTLCSGTPFNFSATPLIAGGTNPTYTWYLNGVAVPGNISPNYSALLNDGDQVQVEMFSNDPCANPTNDLSSIITVSVTSLALTPSVSITASNLTVCSGVPVQFTALPVNGGTAPGYQWQVNGVNLPADTNMVFTTNSLNNGDVVTVEMTSNAPCLTTGTVLSNALSITVNPSVSPAVTLTSSGNTLCTGQSITLNAVVSGGGSSPVYQWFLNGNPIAGATGLSYTTIPSNSDNFTFQLISSDVCDTAGVPVLSAPQIVVVQPSVSPQAVIVVSDSVFCINEIPTFVAQITGGGLTPGYSWFVNGVEAFSGSTNFASNGLQNGDVITFVLTSSAQCASPSSVTSNSISVDIVQLPLVELGNDITIPLGESVTLNASALPGNIFSWSPSTSLDCNSCASVIASPELTTNYKVFVTDPLTGCRNQDSVTVFVETDEIIFLPTGFSPNNDGSNDALFVRGTGIESFLFELYDRFGNLVFSSSDQKQGWDGNINGKPANPGAYTYVITGQFLSGTLINEKGTTTLVR